MFYPLYKIFIGGVGLIATFCVPLVATLRPGLDTTLVAFVLGLCTSCLLIDGLCELFSKK